MERNGKIESPRRFRRIQAHHLRVDTQSRQRRYELADAFDRASALGINRVNNVKNFHRVGFSFYWDDNKKPVGRSKLCVKQNRRADPYGALYLCKAAQAESHFCCLA